MESELADQIEGEFSLPITAKGPDGLSYSWNAMVIFDSRRETVNSENLVVVTKEMVVTLRRTSCPARLLTPTAGDRWWLQIPQNPTTGSAIGNYTLDLSKAPDEGQTIGTIRLYPKKAAQI